MTTTIEHAVSILPWMPPSEAMAIPAPYISKPLIDSFFEGRNARTLAGYRQCLRDFQAFMGVSTIGQAVDLLLAGGHGQANEIALSYRASLIERGLAPGTINHRLTSLRALVKFARTIGKVAWRLEIPNIPYEAYRDTKGPGTEGVRRLLASIKGDSVKAIRDRAILLTLFTLALRRAELASLDLSDLEAGTIAVMGKGRTQKVTLTLPSITRDALASWIEVRGSEPGPLFVRLNSNRAGLERMSGTAIYKVVRETGEAIGLRARPHGLRHAGITEALDSTGGDVRAVQKFSRHRNINVLFIYDDNLSDMAGEVSGKVAAAVA